jgi:hypothetical protein
VSTATALERVRNPKHSGMGAERGRCDRDVEAARCSWLEALFGHGSVVHHPFAAELPVF